VVSLSAAAVAYAGPSSEVPASTPVARGVVLDPMNKPEVYDSLPPRKQAVVDHENQLRSQVLTPAAERTPRFAATPTPEPALPADAGPERRPAGIGKIVERDCEQLLPHANLSTNSWTATLNGKRVVVCAGSEKEDLQAGRVYVTYYSLETGRRLPNQEQPRVPSFSTPRRAGPVSVADAVGDVLVLKATDGTLFYFDVSTLSYVDRPNPEATPGPR
jgi:hypothetical protein